MYTLYIYICRWISYWRACLRGQHFLATNLFLFFLNISLVAESVMHLLVMMIEGLNDS